MSSNQHFIYFGMTGMVTKLPFRKVAACASLMATLPCSQVLTRKRFLSPYHTHPIAMSDHQTSLQYAFARIDTLREVHSHLQRS
ncbi:hypothetical protein O5173_25825, partial [Escherichia coli]|nr:hypothetical protein [Escherichia coli]